MRLHVTLGALAGLLALASRVAVSQCANSTDGAWWTGPMLANSAATLPQGHVLLEPYLYDVRSPRSNSYGSLTYAIYGLTDRVSLGLIPTAGFNAPSDGPRSSAIGVGDLTTHAQFALARFRPCHHVPAMSVAMQETFPTGKYDRLGDRPSDGFGSGAFTTTLAFYSQMYFWLPTGRILRVRLNASHAVSRAVTIRDASVYGTQNGFRGRATLGGVSFVDAAWEYSLTQRWVVALDATYRGAGTTFVDGNDAHLRFGASGAAAFAPAIEYNWSANMGVLLGTRIIPAQGTTTGTITPAIALNMVR